MTLSMNEQDEEYSVQLYVYDLSRGMARSMSMPLMGRQLDGIWHTSIVAWGREYFFGQGISVVSPGTSHHGAPLETHSLGMTSIDHDTFQGALLPDLQQRFRPQDYNLLEWNCNNFSQEVSQILTGNDIPAHIRSLPADFLSTPFGQMLRPQIDAMFRGPQAAPSVGGNDLLSQVAARAYTGNTQIESTAQAPDGNGAVRLLSTQHELNDLLAVYPCVAVLFTSESCPPCKIIKPHFHDLARSHHFDESKPGNHRRIAFVQVDQAYASSQLFQQLTISATPTIKCFTLGKETNQIKGADTTSLTSAVELMLFEVYPPHPHIHLPLKSLYKIPTQPHAFGVHPNFRNAMQKLDSLAAQYPAKTFGDKADFQDARRVFSSTLVPWLETVKQGAPTRTPPATLLQELQKATSTLVRHLPATALFPVMDVMRIAALNESLLQKAFASEKNSFADMLSAVVKLARETEGEALRKGIYLTTARLLANAASTDTFIELTESQESLRALLLELITTFLLYPDAGVRSAAATCAFNIALSQHKVRPEWVSKDPQAPVVLGSRLGEDWESEVASALLQAITNEKESDETLHRLLASLLYHIHLTHYWEESIGPLLQVLEAQDTFRSKAEHELVQKSSKKSELSLLLQDLTRLTACQA